MGFAHIVANNDVNSSGDIRLSRLPVSKPKRIPGARRALGFLVVVWLNLALQPCAMALDGDGDHGCPHCPPEMDHSGMSGHAGGSHPTSPGVPCAVDAFDCMLADDYSHDGRGGQKTLKDAPDSGSAAILQTRILVPDLRREPSPGAVRYRFVAPGTSPPLNVLFCVYLK
jgi:hypothetical protein